MTSDQNNIVRWPKGKLDFSAGCIVMGILNVTPDSFSDGGEFFDVDKAVKHGIQMAADGAAIIDVGGESTRPGSEPVSTKQQIKRVIPVIEGLSKNIEIPVSIDTYNIEVAIAALKAGAAMINDITALSDDRMGKLAAEYKVPVVLMHMQGTPATMQSEPKYEDVVDEVLEFLLSRAKKAERLGIPRDRIFIDPGIGFGKAFEHNLLLLRNLEKFVALEYRVLVGTSRKSFIGSITGKEKPSERIFGTAATVALCAAAGVSIVRVHDVAEMIDVLKVIEIVYSREKETKEYKQNDASRDTPKKIDKKTVNPFAIGGGFLDYCVQQGWIIKQGKSRLAKYFVTDKGNKELGKYGIKF